MQIIVNTSNDGQSRPRQTTQIMTDNANHNEHRSWRTQIATDNADRYQFTSWRTTQTVKNRDYDEQCRSLRTLIICVTNIAHDGQRKSRRTHDCADSADRDEQRSWRTALILADNADHKWCWSWQSHDGQQRSLRTMQLVTNTTLCVWFPTFFSFFFLLALFERLRHC